MKNPLRRTGPRALVVVVCTALAVLWATATSASALNTRTYEQLQNAETHRYCLDIKSEDAAEGARAQLWNCTGVSEQKFILVAADRGQGPVPGQWTIRSKSAGKCLFAGGGAGTRVTQVGCYAYNQAQSWELRPTGEIVNIYSGLCLDTVHDQKGAAVMVWSCNGNIAQRWFF